MGVSVEGVAQAADRAHRDIGEIRPAPEVLPLVDIGKMDFHDWEGISGGIDHDEIHAVLGLRLMSANVWRP
jgi:hypothetical protein